MFRQILKERRLYIYTTNRLFSNKFNSNKFNSKKDIEKRKLLSQIKHLSSELNTRKYKEIKENKKLEDDKLKKKIIEEYNKRDELDFGDIFIAGFLGSLIHPSVGLVYIIMRV